MFNFARIFPKHLILDVDGVLTDGKIYYSEAGKIFKVFGADDHAALKAIARHMRVSVITADFRGFEITSKRIVDDLDLNLELVSSDDRPFWIREKSNIESCIYMGDGMNDWRVFEEVQYSIAPANAFPKTKRYANFVTKSKGAEGAATEACDHILRKFFSTSL